MGSGKPPIFINYRAINPAPIKRLLLLKALIQLIDTRDNYASYENLGLSEDNAELFKTLLLQNYGDHFSPKKKIINLYENYAGKVICEVDLLLEDIFEILGERIPDADDSTVDDYPDSQGPPKKSIIEHDVTKNSLHEYDDIKLESAFNWIFRDNGEQGFVPQEMQNHLQDLRLVDEERIRYYFTYDRILSELVKVYKENTTIKIRKNKLFQIRWKLGSYLNEFIRCFTDKSYWNKLKTESENVISNIDYLFSHFKKGKLKLFLVFEGDPGNKDGNRVIGRYNNRIVLFDKAASLYRELQPQQLILAEFESEHPTSYVFIPKKILSDVDAKQMIKLGVEACPSIDTIISFLNGV